MKKQLITANFSLSPACERQRACVSFKELKNKERHKCCGGYLTVLFQAFLKYQELISDSIIMFSVHTLSIALLQCDLS